MLVGAFNSYWVVCIHNLVSNTENMGYIQNIFLISVRMVYPLLMIYTQLQQCLLNLLKENEVERMHWGVFLYFMFLVNS